MKDIFYMPTVEEYSDGSKLLGMFMGDNPRKVSGITLLMQVWVSTFLSEVGQSVFDYSGGGGIQSLIGQNATSIAGKDLRNILTIATQKTNEEVIKNQLEEGITDDDELLETAYLIKISTEGSSSADVHIRLTSKAGNSVPAAIPFAF